MIHGESEAGEDLARAAFEAVRDLDEERATLYTDVVLKSLHVAAKAILEDLMAHGTYEYQSDFAKRYFAQGRAEGEAQGRAEGEAQGRAEGEARGRALAILAVLAARGVDIALGVRERVLGCSDLTTLDAWLDRAATANDASEVIDR